MSTFDTIKSNINTIASEVNTTSSTNILTKIAKTFADVIDLFNTEIENTKKTLIDDASNLSYGRQGYYTSKALAYQEGDSLLINAETGALYYETIDEEKQIIKQAAFEDVIVDDVHFLTLKVAVQNPSTLKLEALTGDRFTAFSDYMVNFEIPGLHLYTFSGAPNVFDFVGTVIYSKTANLDTTTASVEAAFESFRDTFQFNGILYLNTLAQYIKSNVVGVIDVIMASPTIDSVAFTSYTKCAAGYFEYDTNTLTSITYTGV